MDQELLAAIGEILDKKLDEKLDEKIAPINRQIDNISRTVVDVLNDVHKLSEGQARLESEVGELHKGQERLETRLDCVEADVKAIGDMYRDHETQIGELLRKVASS